MTAETTDEVSSYARIIFIVFLLVLVVIFLWGPIVDGGLTASASPVDFNNALISLLEGLVALLFLGIVVQGTFGK